MSVVAPKATWFGDPACPLLGWLHIPTDSMVHGAVVLCPPVGKDLMSAARAVRILAQRLAGRGFLVLRFDYAGTGDSAGPIETGDQLAQWRASIEQAIGLVEGFGVTEISLVGMNLGGLMLSELPSSIRLRSLVLWDPATTGATYLREQRALYRMSLGRPPGTGRADLSGLGMTYTEPTVHAVQQLSLATLRPAEIGDGDDVLALLRESGMADAGRDFLLETPGITVVDAVGQREFLDVPSYDSVVPTATLNTIEEFLAARRAESATAVKLDNTVVTRAIVGELADGRRIEESLDRFGDKQLFGITTQLVDATGVPVEPKAPTQLLLSSGIEHHAGSVGLWTELAREAAVNGVRSIRFDRSDIGESMGADDLRQGLMYDSLSIEDTVAVAHEVRPFAEEVHLVGHCSGSWAAAQAASAIGADSVVLLAPAIWHRAPIDLVPRQLGAAEQEIVEETPSRRQRVVRSAREMLKRHVPYRIWRDLGRDVPEGILADLVQHGVEVRMIMSDFDMERFRQQRGPEGLARLRAQGFDVLVAEEPRVDHALFDPAGRAFVRSRLLEWIGSDSPAMADTSRLVHD